MEREPPGRWRRPAVVEKLREADTDWKLFVGNRPVRKNSIRANTSSSVCSGRTHLEFRTNGWFHRLYGALVFRIAAAARVVANGGIYLLERRAKKLGHHDSGI